jgi:peptidoglycan/LPS O-acetylase OafA/YrhL
LATVEGRLDLHRNALNLIRLVLATLVIVSHSWPLGGFGGDPNFFGTSLGGLAVGGFFTISGYLIAHSRMSQTAGKFLVRRFFRIFPAYWVVLLFVGFGTSWLIADLTGNPWKLADAAAYVGRGFPLVLGQGTTLNGVLNGLPYGFGMNGSLWTLAPEFLFYLALAAVMGIRFVRKSKWFVGASYVLVLLVGFLVQKSTWLALTWSDLLTQVLILLSFFMAGVVVFWYRKYLISNGWLAMTSGVLFLAISSLGWGSWLGSLPLAYFILWLGSVAPSWLSRLGSKNDFSYGVYIYAFPVQQLLAALGVQSAGVWVFVLVSCLATASFAVASWFLVEEPAQAFSRRLTRTPAQ